MTIFEFDITKGLYHFEFEGLTTELHAHPVVEIIHASMGTFTLESNGQIHEHLTFAIIDANTKHKIVSHQCTVNILMVESHNQILSDFLKSKGLEMDQGSCVKSSFSEGEESLSKLKQFAHSSDLKTPTDSRIATAIQLMATHELEYKNLMSALTAQVHLSESRFSHLFKEHIGVSVKKYLVWHRLRQAIHHLLAENSNLTEASLESGFFDQAHLSKSFRSVLGVNPSKAYNSRIVQL